MYKTLQECLSGLVKTLCYNVGPQTKTFLLQPSSRYSKSIKTLSEGIVCFTLEAEGREAGGTWMQLVLTLVSSPPPRSCVVNSYL